MKARLGNEPIIVPLQSWKEVRLGSWMKPLLHERVVVSVRITIILPCVGKNHLRNLGWGSLKGYLKLTEELLDHHPLGRVSFEKKIPRRWSDRCSCIFCTKGCALG